MILFDPIFEWGTLIFASIYIWTMYLLGSRNENKTTKQLNIVSAFLFTVVFWILWIFLIF